MDIIQSKDDFLAKQSHKQLEIFIHNYEYIEESLRNRLFLLSGCHDFGNQDGTNGSCIECYYNNPVLHHRCCLFQDSLYKYIKDVGNNNAQ